MRCLFLTYNGMSSHIGQAQVVPYLTGLAARGHEITIVSFERESDADSLAGVEQLLAENEIDWRPQAYSSLRGPLGKVADQHHVVKVAKRVAAEVRPNLVHCRSYVPGEAALAVKRATGAHFLFDMRGFWVDQRAEGMRWPQNQQVYRWLYRKWKDKEATFVNGADKIITLTDAAKREVECWSRYKGAPIEVIPCAVDYDSFGLPDDEARRVLRDRIGMSHSERLFVYLGSLGSVYLLDDIFRCFATARDILGGGRLLFLGRHSAEGLLKHARGMGLDFQDGDILSRRATRAEVPTYLGAADVGLSFIVPSYSSLGVSPTKLGEYFACGLPVICNRGVGDVEQIVSKVSGGMVLGAEVKEELTRRKDELLRLIELPRASIRDASQRILDLDLAIDAYDRVYRSHV